KAETSSRSSGRSSIGLTRTGPAGDSAPPASTGSAESAGRTARARTAGVRPDASRKSITVSHPPLGVRRPPVARRSIPPANDTKAASRRGIPAREAAFTYAYLAAMPQDDATGSADRSLQSLAERG